MLISAYPLFLTDEKEIIMLYQKEVISVVESSGMDWWAKILIYIGLFLICGFMLYLKERSIKRCLVWACTEAERILGTKTGKLKLKMVYDTFVEKCPVISAFIPFAIFSRWVDTALEEMKMMIENNCYIRGYIEKGE